MVDVLTHRAPGSVCDGAALAIIVRGNVWFGLGILCLLRIFFLFCYVIQTLRRHRGRNQLLFTIAMRHQGAAKNRMTLRIHEAYLLDIIHNILPVACRLVHTACLGGGRVEHRLKLRRLHRLTRPIYHHHEIIALVCHYLLNELIVFAEQVLNYLVILQVLVAGCLDFLMVAVVGRRCLVFCVLTLRRIGEGEELLVLAFDDLKWFLLGIGNCFDFDAVDVLDLSRRLLLLTLHYRLGIVLASLHHQIRAKLVRVHPGSRGQRRRAGRDHQRRRHKQIINIAIRVAALGG